MGITTAATKRASLCACEFIAKPVDFDHLKAQLLSFFSLTRARETKKIKMLRKWRRLRYESAHVSGSTARRRSLLVANWLVAFAAGASTRYCWTKRQSRASRIILNGVSAARLTEAKPPAVMTSRSFASPA